MKRWISLLSILFTLGGMMSLAAPNAQAQNQDPAQDGPGRKMIYMFSDDFPPDLFFQHPQPPVRTTRFWQILDKAMNENTDLQLTEDVEEANYRVELMCTGITWCGKVRVDVMTPNRDVLATYSIPGKLPFLWPNIAVTAQRIASTLDSRIAAIEEGGVGNYGMVRYRYRYGSKQKKSPDSGIKTISNTSNADVKPEQPAQNTENPATP